MRRWNNMATSSADILDVQGAEPSPQGAVPPLTQWADREHPVLRTQDSGLRTQESALGTQNSKTNRQDLLEMFAAYTEVTNRLRESHERLQGEVGRLRDELAAKNRELRRRERLASLGQMAAGLAHEIRNPLGAIALYVSMLQQDLADRPEQVQRAGKIGMAVSGLNRLVTSILEFAPPREPVRRMVAFRRVLSQAIPAVSPLLEEKAIEPVRAAAGSHHLRRPGGTGPGAGQPAAQCRRGGRLWR